MFKERKLFRSLVVVATLALYATMVQTAAARGGGHAGGGHHGGGHHGGGHHGGGHHGGGHHANHHPYHPSHHHTAHHSHEHHGDHHHDGHHDHHDHHHYAHHHHGWHHGGWGPGFWGGAAAGYGLGYGYSNWGGWGYDGDAGDTYVDNSTNVTPVSNDGDDTSDADESNAQESTTSNEGQEGFPTDDWPELGVVTYSGQYGASQGQVIVRVVPGSAAEKAGLVPGDVILSFNGKPVPSADDLDAAMDNAGGKFEVVVWDARTGRKSTIDGALDPGAPAPPANETAAAPPVQQ